MFQSQTDHRWKKWRMRIACWMITKATDTHSEYVILIPFPLKWFHERVSVLRYTYIACFVKPFLVLTLILLTWRIWWAPNNDSRWQMGFNSAFKGLKYCIKRGDHVRENILLLMPINVTIGQHNIIFLFSKYNVVLTDCNNQPHYLIT